MDHKIEYCKCICLFLIILFIALDIWSISKLLSRRRTFLSLYKRNLDCVKELPLILEIKKFKYYSLMYKICRRGRTTLRDLIVYIGYKLLNLNWISQKSTIFFPFCNELPICEPSAARHTSKIQSAGFFFCGVCISITLSSILRTWIEVECR